LIAFETQGVSCDKLSVRPCKQLLLMDYKTLNFATLNNAILTPKCYSLEWLEVTPSEIEWACSKPLVRIQLQLELKEESALNWELDNAQQSAQEEVRDYVAQLQLHMTLQARNLVPSLTQARDSREQLLQETQANVEKLASRQI